MALINIFSNWQKARDYDKLEEINDKLCVELHDLKQDIKEVEDYAIGMLTDAPYVQPRLSEIIDVISDYRIRVSDLYMQINRLKSQLQKRDKKTGRFVKK
jgi:hypothetical protein